MSDFYDISPVAIIGFLVVAAIVVIAIIIHAEDAEMARFQQRCILAGETPAKCEILSEIKRSADDASLNAAFAVGYFASRR